MNAREYLNSTFLKKADVRASGPQRLTIKDVEPADGFPGRKGEPAVPELQLVFTNDQKWALRAQVNLRRMLEAFGDDTAAWVGKTIEVYFNPDVTNPAGGEPGGLRLRIPEPKGTKKKAGSFRSELDAPTAAVGAAVVTDDDIPF